MIHSATRDNILELLNNIPAATVDQLVTFFSQELVPSKVKVVLNDLVSTNAIVYDEQMHCLRERFTHYRKVEITRKFLTAFWPIAYMGSREVTFVSQCYYPIQYFVITENLGTFTFNLCETSEDARNGAIRRDMLKLNGREDDLRHIAVINNKTMQSVAASYEYERSVLVTKKIGTVEVEWV